MKLMDRIKKMDKIDRSILIFTILILILLSVNAWANISHAKEYVKRVEAGNARWEQVNERIEQYEHKIDILEKDIENLQIKLESKGGQ